MTLAPTQQTTFALYDLIEPYDSSFLKVSDLHSLYYEQSGNPEGNPIVFMHGGPGSGTSPENRRFFDPNAYRIILFDQRGAGKSIPHACLEENDTWSLVADIEKLRAHLGIDRWVVFGGSWGSTLALTYAIKHPTVVKALILRGIFTLRRAEVEWYYEEANGASFVFPDAWEDYVRLIPEEERGDIIGAYHRKLTGDDEKIMQEAATAWSLWECRTSRLLLDRANEEKASDNRWALAFARIENHYFKNKGFFPTDGWILDNVKTICEHGIPGWIVQGRYDIVCPVATAWALHRQWPEAEFFMVPDAGHSWYEAGILTRLVEGAEKFKNV